MTKFEKRLIAQILTAALAFTCFAGVNPADRAYAAEVQDEQQMESTATDNTKALEEGSRTDLKREVLTSGDYKYYVNDDGNIVIRSYIGQDQDVTIPKQIDQKNVVEIGMFAFEKAQITTVTIPDTVTDIQYGAFRYSKLQTIEMTENSQLQTIDSQAFNGCKELESVQIPDTVDNIQYNAFSECTSLKDIKLPSGVTFIGNELFMGCTALEKVMIPDSVQRISKGAFSASREWSETERDFLHHGKCSENLKIYYAGTQEQWNTIEFPDDLDFPVYYNAQNCYDGNHVYGEWVTEKDASIYEEGCQISTCQICSDQITQKIDRVELEISGVKAVAAGKNKVYLTWNSTPQAEGYLIYGQRGTDGQYGYIGMTGKTEFTDTKALDSVYNFYWVYPYVTDADGKILPSTSTSYVYAKGVLPAATNFKAASAGKNKVSLSWDKVDGADGYIVYAKKNGTYAYCGMTTKGTTYTDTKALDTEYNFYWVYPYANGADGKRIIGCGTKYIYAKGVLPAVSNLKAAGTKSGVTVSWSKMKDATGYIIYKKNAQTGKFEYLSMTGNASYVDKTASKTAYNFYRVYAYYKDANGKRVLGTSDTYVYAKSK